MGIADLKNYAADVPGIGTLTMDYENGGAVQVFRFDGKVARVPAMANNEEIKAALLEATPE